MQQEQTSASSPGRRRTKSLSRTPPPATESTQLLNFNFPVPCTAKLKFTRRPKGGTLQYKIPPYFSAIGASTSSPRGELESTISRP